MHDVTLWDHRLDEDFHYHLSLFVRTVIFHYLKLLFHPWFCKNKNTLGSVPMQQKLSQKASRQVYKNFSSLTSGIEEGVCLGRFCFVYL